MNRLKYALWITAAGLVVGAVLLAMESALDWVADDVLPHWAMVALGMALLTTLLVVLVWAGIIAVFGKREPSPSRGEALRYAYFALQSVPRDGEILSSKNGDFMHVVLRMPPEKWNDAFDFFDANVAYHTPQVWETDFHYYLFLLYENGRASTIPIPFGTDAAGKIGIRFCYAGFRKYALQGLSGIHRVFAEADGIGILRTMVTGVCVFFLAYLQKGVDAKWRTYCVEKMYPYLQGQTDVAVPPPAMVSFSHVEISFRPAIAPRELALRVDFENDRTPAATLSRLRALIDHFALFECGLGSTLELPYEAD